MNSVIPGAQNSLVWFGSEVGSGTATRGNGRNHSPLKIFSYFHTILNLGQTWESVMEVIYPTGGSVADNVFNQEC